MESEVPQTYRRDTVTFNIFRFDIEDGVIPDVDRKKRLRRPMKYRAGYKIDVPFSENERPHSLIRLLVNCEAKGPADFVSDGGYKIHWHLSG